MVNNYTHKLNTLSNGTKIPSLGYGSAQETENIEQVIYEAIKVGYRHIDTAHIYANEEGIGRGLKRAFDEGLVKREEVYVVTKLWGDDKEDVEKAIKASLAKLQLDYVDLYLIHWPIGIVDHQTDKLKKQVPLHVTWKALEEQVRAGRTRSIGVSNFNVQLLIDLLSYAEIKPVINQIEVHPYLTQEDLVDFCRKNDVEVTAYSPLGGNFPHNPKYTAQTLLVDPTLNEIAKKHGKTVGQVVLAWHLARGYTVIPKTSTSSRLKENFEADTFELTAEEVKAITALNKNARNIHGTNDRYLANIPIFA